MQTCTDKQTQRLILVLSLGPSICFCGAEMQFSLLHRFTISPWRQQENLTLSLLPFLKKNIQAHHTRALIVLWVRGVTLVEISPQLEAECEVHEAVCDWAQGIENWRSKPGVNTRCYRKRIRCGGSVTSVKQVSACYRFYTSSSSYKHLWSNASPCSRHCCFTKLINTFLLTWVTNSTSLLHIVVWRYVLFLLSEYSVGKRGVERGEGENPEVPAHRWRLY